MSAETGPCVGMELVRIQMGASVVCAPVDISYLSIRGHAKVSHDNIIVHVTIHFEVISTCPGSNLDVLSFAWYISE